MQSINYNDKVFNDDRYNQELIAIEELFKGTIPDQEYDKLINDFKNNCHKNIEFYKYNFRDNYLEPYQIEFILNYEFNSWAYKLDWYLNRKTNMEVGVKNGDKQT